MQGDGVKELCQLRLQRSGLVLKIGEETAKMGGSKTTSLNFAQLLLLLLTIASAFEGGSKKRIDYCLF